MIGRVEGWEKEGGVALVQRIPEHLGHKCLGDVHMAKGRSHRAYPLEYRADAVRLVREQYEHAAAMRHVRLEAVNRVRPPSMRYRSVDELVREWMSAAGAVSTFAVNLGLFTPEQARQVILEFQTTHPE